MASDIYTATAKMLTELSYNSTNNKAQLAQLRHVNSINDPKANVLWPLIFKHLPEKYLTDSGKPTYAENAIFTVLKLFATQQQGRIKAISTSKYDYETLFFSQLSKLKNNTKISEALDRRVNQLLGSTDYTTVIYQLTSLNTLLKSNQKGLEINFAQLAQDLYSFQFSFENANQVKLRWGKQYFSYHKTLGNQESEIK